MTLYDHATDTYYVPISAKLVLDGWSAPVQLKFVDGDAGPEMVIRASECPTCRDREAARTLAGVGAT